MVIPDPNPSKAYSDDVIGTTSCDLDVDPK
jgi:hypothetical protein